MNYERCYLVYWESANYAGAGEYWVVEADDADHAMERTGYNAEEFFYEQDGEQYLEENGEDDGVMWASHISTQSWAELDEQHRNWIRERNHCFNYLDVEDYDF